MRTSPQGRLFRSLGVTLLVFAVLGSPLSQSIGVTARAAAAEPITAAATEAAASRAAARQDSRVKVTELTTPTTQVGELAGRPLGARMHR
ncbi:hypothetical protein [Actinopolyspora mortivallis]|uniref:Uncharacterized protein n=1 Tax=Actinopolyspora mortivallis TaxID=33906 RepID=A0A2T0GWX5_ACTMO|nr:hypothetical protein [Actinopolyspora mortivallis]PRW63616.1 hypothetical protein CEP50_09090 [Actinopolyspora mortivallis]